MTSKKKVKYYFAYNSPYAFLASTRIEKELDALRFFPSPSRLADSPRAQHLLTLS